MPSIAVRRCPITLCARISNHGPLMSFSWRRLPSRTSSLISLHIGSARKRYLAPMSARTSNPGSSAGSIQKKNFALYHALRRHFDKARSTRHSSSRSPAMNERPEVSVIITTYNRLPMFKRALAGVFRQTFKNLEIIVADAGHDGTLSYLNLLRLPVRSVSVRGNPGVATLMNAGLALARGRFIAFLESDDYWAPEYLETMLAAFRSRDIKSVSSAWWIATEEGEIVHRYHWRDAVVFDPEVALYPRRSSGSRFYWGWHLSFNVFRREVFSHLGGFDPHLKWEGVDVDLYARMTLTYGARGFVRIDEPLGLYTRHPSAQLTELSNQAALNGCRIPVIFRRDRRYKEILIDRAYFQFKHATNWSMIERELPSKGISPYTTLN